MELYRLSCQQWKKSMQCVLSTSTYTLLMLRHTTLHYYESGHDLFPVIKHKVHLETVSHIG